MSLSSVYTKQYYDALHHHSLEDVDQFWLEQAQNLSWMSDPKSALDKDSIWQWFPGGMLNVCYNCIDRHANSNPSKVAIIYDDGQCTQRLSYSHLLKEISLASNMLIEMGLKLHDTVTIYLDSPVDTAVFMLACARVGMKHNVVYKGFSPVSLSQKLHLSGSSLLICEEDSTPSGTIFSEEISILEQNCPNLDKILWLGATKARNYIQGMQHYHYLNYRSKLPLNSTPMPRKSNDDLMLFCDANHSGLSSTVTYNCGGFLLYNALSFQLLTDIKDDDIYWCGYDLGWFEGQALGLYAPLTQGATIYMPSSLLKQSPEELLQRLSLLKISHGLVKGYWLKDISHQGLLNHNKLNFKNIIVSGDNPDFITWSSLKSSLPQDHIIKNALIRADFGGIILSNWHTEQNAKPGSYGVPFPGIDLKVVDDRGYALEPKEEGQIQARSPWPCAPKDYFFTDSSELDTGTTSDSIKYPTVLQQASQDYDGDYWVFTEKDSEITTNGYSIFLEDLDSILEKSDFVLSAVVFPTPNSNQSNDLCAFIVPYLPKNSDQVYDFRDIVESIKDHLKQQIGNLIDIKHIILCDSLPLDKHGIPLRSIVRKAIDSVDGYNTISEDEYANIPDPSQLKTLMSQYRNYDI